MSVTLIPTYGRDYNSIKAVQEHFDMGRDFVVADISNRWHGKVCNKSDLTREGYTEVRIRYSKLRKITVIRIPYNVIFGVEDGMILCYRTIGFVNLIVSPVGYGNTEKDAFNDLLENEVK